MNPVLIPLAEVVKLARLAPARIRKLMDEGAFPFPIVCVDQVESWDRDAVLLWVKEGRVSS